MRIQSRLHFPLAIYAGRRELLTRRSVVSAEQHVPRCEECGEVLVLMLQKAAVVDAVILGTDQQETEAAEMPLDVEVYEILECSVEGPDGNADGQSQLHGVCLVEFEQDHHWNGHEQIGDHCLEPVVPTVREDVELLVHV